MNSSIPAKQKLRAGKFKKILLDTEGLALEAPGLHATLAQLYEDYLNQTLTSAEYAALWLVAYLRTRHPYGWWGAHRRDSVHSHKLTKLLSDYPYFAWSAEELKLLSRYPTLGELLNHRAFRATPLPVHRALLAWSNGDYDLILMDRIPSVQEVLEQQIQGRRCVTLFHQLSRLSTLVLGERDPLSFGMHDLIHADHFFHANGDQAGQIGFYRIIHQLLRQEYLKDFFHVDGFEGRLEYLMADMNSHPLHLWKCFRAICDISFKDQSLTLFNEQLPRLLGATDLVAHSLQRLNSDDFVLESHGVALTEMCQQQGR